MRAQSFSWAVPATALCAMAMAWLARGNPTIPPEPVPLYTVEELRQAAGGEIWGQRRKAAVQIARLGAAHRDLIEEFLRSPYEDIRRSAIAALMTIGDQEALALLRRVVADTTRDRNTIIAAGEALGDAGDRNAIPLLQAIADNTGDKYLKEYLLRAAKRIQSPGYDAPLLDIVDDFVTFRFLKEDIASIRITNYHLKTRHPFGGGDFQRVCELLQQGHPAHVGEIIQDQRLVIELHDGRRAMLEMDGDALVYPDTSHFFHRWHFAIKAEALAAYVRQCMDR